MNRKNMLIAFLIITALFCNACGRKVPNQGQRLQSKLTITTSFYPIYILTLNVTKDIPGVNVVNMAKPQTGCLHDYQLTPDDLSTLEDAQVFIVNGAGMESFLEKVFSQLPNLKIINSSSGISLLKDPNSNIENPHVWLSIHNAILQVQNIENQLAKIDKTHAINYRENANNYIQKLKNLENKMKSELSGVRNRNIITFHEAFPYFADEYNLNIAAVIEREPGSEPSAKDMANIINTINNSKTHIIFVEPQYSAKSAEAIARETGAKIYNLNPIVTGPDSANAYISIMENNLKTLKEALK